VEPLGDRCCSSVPIVCALVVETLATMRKQRRGTDRAHDDASAEPALIGSLNGLASNPSAFVAILEGVGDADCGRPARPGSPAAVTHCGQGAARHHPAGRKRMSTLEGTNAYSTPRRAEYIAVCRPACWPETVHRDAG
jgi:hypothetical protein